jgi:hypothetical protein
MNEYARWKILTWATRAATAYQSHQIRQPDILWRAAPDEAAGWSQSHTPKLDPWSLDLLHAACARELWIRYFLTLDQRQQFLAAAAGLKIARL